jgi:hypothetical protein
MWLCCPVFLPTRGLSKLRTSNGTARVASIRSRLDVLPLRVPLGGDTFRPNLGQQRPLEPEHRNVSSFPEPDIAGCSM